MPDENVPPIDGRFICIVDREAVVLAALASSYLNLPGTYLPMFLFPRVKHPLSETDTPFGDQYLSNLAGRNASIYINNAWARMGPRDTVIMVGLSEEQKSYLLLPEKVKLLQIASISDVKSQLLSFFGSNSEELKCKSSDVLQGLAIALSDGKRLAIDEDIHVVARPGGNKRGIVVVESINADASPVVAINYASAVHADICIVDALGQYEGRDAQTWVYSWKEKNDLSGFEGLKNAAAQRIGTITFSNYEYATFFTEGLPYFLAIENVIPCSHV